MITIDELKSKLNGYETAVNDLRRLKRAKSGWPSWNTR